MRRRPPDRYLSMLEVAELLGAKHTSKRRKAEFARRLIRRIEQRDKRKYLMRFGGRKYHLAVSALAQLMPWDPTTLVGMRSDMREIGQSVRALKRQTNSHGARIKNLEKFRRATTRFIAEMADSV